MLIYVSSLLSLMQPLSGIKGRATALVMLFPNCNHTTLLPKFISILSLSTARNAYNNLSVLQTVTQQNVIYNIEEIHASSENAQQNNKQRTTH